ncbi:MAG: tetratricopeptide repeat protein [Candidatus Celaenobacter polaris]|nr:tetratricopeptide repeat protein [Candidatus Celaenobacter polaris]
MKLYTDKPLRIGFAAVLLIFTLIISDVSLIEGSEKAITPDPQKMFSSAGSMPEMESVTGEIPDWMARWELARVLSYIKRYDESVAEYRNVIQEKPALHKARVELANVLSWWGKPDEALIELKSVPTDTIDVKTKILLADLYMGQKNYKKAAPLYAEYLEKNPKDDKVRLKLAEMLSWSKRYDESIAEYKIILKSRPDDMQVRRKYAFVLSWAGRYPEAIKELRKTLE